MKRYKLVYDYTDLGCIEEYYIYKLRFGFFGLIPLEWDLKYCCEDIDNMATWINDNVEDQTERIKLKSNLYDGNC